MSNSYYQRLGSLVDTGRLQLYIIIAPSRSNSSVVEHSLGNSPDIEHECHEPFINVRNDKFDSDHGYKQIYQAIGGENFIQSDKTTAVVVKEMSHWISKNEEYKKLFKLTNKPIVFLLRNPLLTAESRMFRVLKTMDMKSDIDLQRYLLDKMAIAQGFENWNSLAKEIKDGGYKERLDFLPGKEGIERIYNTPILTIQNHLLNLQAHKEGYANWQDIIEKKLYTEHDYIWFEAILQANKQRVDFEKIEFKKLAEEIQYIEDQKQEYLLFDSTDIRIAPEDNLQELCSKLDIRFSPEMIQWGNKPVDFHTEQVKQSENLWYDNLRSSSRINPPTEIPPPITNFPEFMQEYLRSVNLPIYAEILKKKIVSKRARDELNDRELTIKLTNGNIKYFRELGLIYDDTQPGERISVKMKHIDPIYATINDHTLIKKTEFQIFRNKYSEEIKIVSNIITK